MSYLIADSSNPRILQANLMFLKEEDFYRGLFHFLCHFSLLSSRHSCKFFHEYLQTFAIVRTTYFLFHLDTEFESPDFSHMVGSYLY
jgi:hypothetical protein